MNKFKDRLTELLHDNGLTQSELAKMVFVSQSAISRYCTGENIPSIDVLLLICKILDVSADYLLGFTD
ncbi:MAG: helix-turn-helix domain-containing protein [Clostridia bacterium]|nr:helix-turn-helix domain-containing protein [Clostridia bacterium]